MSINRLKDEQDFHDNRFGGADIREKAGKFYYANQHHDARFFELTSLLCKGKKLLEYGCGSGTSSIKWIETGAQVTGIDISPEGINAAKKLIENTSYTAEFYVMNAENMGFDDNFFDVIVGASIVHHLELTQAYKELNRILKKDGHLVLSEPLGHNPFINLYRTLTPKLRTKDEHPLLMKDIELLKNYFNNLEVEYYSLFTILAVPFRDTSFFDRFSDFFRAIDKILFQITIMQKFAWFAIIHASNPKK